MTFWDEFPSLAGGALQVDPLDLAEAFRLMSRVYSGIEPYDTGNYRIEMLNEDGQQEYIQAEDTPLNRVLLALKEWYHEEPVEQYISLCWRLFCLSKLVREGALEDWIRSNPLEDTLYISGSVIRAAAELPLTSMQGFNRDLFVATLIELS